MKTISKIFGLMLVVAITFSSCGSDDDEPTPVPVLKDTTIVYTAKIAGIAQTGGVIAYTLPELTIAKILGETNAKNFIKGEFQNSGTYFEITGLKDVAVAPSLENFTLRVNNESEVNFGTCKANGTGNNEFSSDTQQSGNNYLTFVSSIFNSVTGKSRKATLYIKFTPTKSVQETDNVMLKIAIRGKYTYNTYPSVAK